MYTIKNGTPHKEILVEVPRHPPAPRQFYILIPEDSPIDREKILKEIKFFKISHKEIGDYDWANAKIETE